MLTLSQFTPTSTIEALPNFTYEVDTQTLTRNVSEKFASDPELPGVLLTTEGVAQSAISRFRFESHMKRAYSSEIYSKRPIEVLLESIKGNVLLLPASTTIPAAATLAFDRESEFVYDPVVITLNDQTRKLIDCKVLVRAALQILKTLMDS